MARAQQSDITAAEKMLAEGRLVEAENRLKQTFENTSSVRALILLARLEGSRGQPENALAYLQQAVDIAPNSEEVLSSFARLSLALGRPSPAVAALDALIAMHPSVPDYHYQVGVARVQIGALTSGSESLEEARRLAPQRPLTLIALGLARNRQKRFEEARDALTNALALEPGNIEALAALAEAREGLGELEEAEELAQQVLADDASNNAKATANVVLGMVLIKRQSYDEALEVLNRVVRMDADSYKGHYQLSLAYARLGDRENARKHQQLSREALARVDEQMTALREAAGIQEEDGGM